MNKTLRTCGKVGTPFGALLGLLLIAIFHKEEPVLPLSALATDLPQALQMNFEVAATEATREKGLRGHAPLKDDEGMMLVFEKPQIVCLWNKGVSFPIDVAILDNDQHILGHVSMQANSERKVCSPVETKYILEAKLGTFDKYEE